MTVPELRRAYPAEDPRWDARALEIFRAARQLAWAARPVDSAAPDAERHWSQLPAGERNRWTICAWHACTGSAP